jgi:hypothetical protein
MVAVIVADMFYLTGVFELEDNRAFTLVNLLVLGVGLWSFRVKRGLRARLAERRSGLEEPEPEEKG